MQEVLEKIVNKCKELLGDRPYIKKINRGFTNTIYNVDDKYIIKICTNKDNEEKFKKEINFYKENKNNGLIPKLYSSDTTKKYVSFMYEILEKIDGNSLYDVWHILQEEERENIIKQLCAAMKKFHSYIGNSYSWENKTSEIYISLMEKVTNRKLFSKEELNLLDEAYQKFNELLHSDKFVLVHNDLHFDNILYHNGKIKLIDFERSLYAPIDFELDILYRMVRKPWKFASEENEIYTKVSDYKNIMKYIEKYYPEIFETKDLYKRLAIYDIVYYLKHYINHPEIEELKEDILTAAKIVLEKE